MKDGQTVAALIKNAGFALTEAGNENARLEAELLLAHQLDCSRTRFVTWPEESVPASERDAFRRCVDKRCRGVPLAYITGECEFWSLPLSVSPQVLIPRQDTETLVEQAVELPLPDDAGVLDMGTGCGAIALALASERYGWRITAIDISPAALAVARRNGQDLGRANVRFIESDGFDSMNGGLWHLIVSNPPYVAVNDEHLNRGDLRYEPRSALEAGPDGLAVIRRIVSQSPSHLRSAGWLLLEHGYDQAEDVVSLLGEAGFCGLFSRRDLTGRFRVSGGRWPGGNA